MQLRKTAQLGTSHSSSYTEISAELARYDVQHGRKLSTNYLAHVDNARASVLDRLVSALIREGILDTELCKAHELIIETIAVTSTGRLGLVSPVRWSDGTAVTDPVSLLENLIELGIGRVDEWQRLIFEIQNSVSGQALAFCAADQRAEQLGAHRARGADSLRSKIIGQGNPFSTLVNALRDKGDQGSLLSAFEQLVIDGHPLHPCAKIKIGMSATDSVLYGPEFGVSFDLRLVAVSRHSAKVSVGEDMDEQTAFHNVIALLRKAFPSTMAAVEAELISANRDPMAHVIIPVHPHQLSVTLPRLHAKALADGTVFLLSAYIPARPLMSVRTLEVKETRISTGLHVKTALEVQLSGAIRGVSRESAHNSPKMCELFSAIAKQDLDLQRIAKNGGPTFAVCIDLAGIAYLPQYASDRSAEDTNLDALNRSLNAILRQNPEVLMGEGEVAMPIASLFARSPITGRTIMADLLTELGTMASKDATLTGLAEDWLRQHVELCVPPALTLLSRYGIALEPHPQNTVLVLRDGHPNRIIVRDLGGARVFKEQLDRSGFSVNLMPGTGLWAKSAESLRNKLFFPLFVNHLGELVATISDAASCSETPLWAVVRECVSRTFLQLQSAASSVAEAEGIAEHAQALLQQPWQLKTVLSMRIFGLVRDQRYTNAPNPLTMDQTLVPTAQELQPADLNCVEQNMFDQLMANDPNLARLWLLELKAARETTVQDVCAALLRENGPGSALLDGLEASRPEELLDQLVAADITAKEPFNWVQLREELVHSACNLALSRACVRRRGEQLRLRAARLATEDIISTLAATCTPSDVTLDIDGLCAEGHNLHPCKRNRTGFSPTDSLVYTAECHGYVGVQFLAVRRELTLSTPDSEGYSVGEIIGQHYPEMLSKAVAALRRRGGQPDEYEFLPVHPWQAKYALPKHYAEELATGAILLLPEAQLRCRPTISVRSMVTAAPGKLGKRLTIKTAIDIVLTSTRRTMSVATTRNCPPFSSLLEKILTEELNLSDKVCCVQELAGNAFAPPPSENTSSAARVRGLSVLVREDPADRLLPGEHMISGCGLSAISPLSGMPLLTELINKSTKQNCISLAESARSFLKTYAHLLCSVALPLLWGYGIGLELHLQNMLLVIRNYQPIRLVLRDFSGLRMHLGRMQEAKLNFVPAPDSMTVTVNLDIVRAKLSHSLILANFTEVVKILSTASGLKAKELYSVVRDVMHRIRDTSHPALRARADEELAQLLRPTLQGKACATMRIVQTKHDIYRPQPNPLHVPGEQTVHECLE
ncbi:unnamed protein product [Calypogeia fissa]